MKATVFIDGGYLRALARKAGYRYDPNCRGPRAASSTRMRIGSSSTSGSDVAAR